MISRFVSAYVEESAGTSSRPLRSDRAGVLLLLGPARGKSSAWQQADAVRLESGFADSL